MKSPHIPAFAPAALWAQVCITLEGKWKNKRMQIKNGFGSSSKYCPGLIGLGCRGGQVNEAITPLLLIIVDEMKHLPPRASLVSSQL